MINTTHKVKEKMTPQDFKANVRRRHLTEMLINAVHTHRQSPIDIRLNRYTVDTWDKDAFTYTAHVTHLRDMSNHVYRVTIYADFDTFCEKLR